MDIYFWYYQRSRELFRKLEEYLNDFKDNQLAEKIEYCKYLISLADATDVYVSEAIEHHLCVISSQIEDKITDLPFEKKTVLHVASRLYEVGGHTRIIERWIEFDDGMRNDLAILDSGSVIPDRLKEILKKKGGKLNVCSNSDELSRAYWLRELAARYEYIVLHVHPSDLTPVLSFGISWFKRPVLYFNHTDHMFWVGVRVADVILDMSTLGKEFTAIRRGRADSCVLPIPIDKDEDQAISADAKKIILKKYGIDHGKKVLLSIGHSYKYTPQSPLLSFHALCYNILIKNKNLSLIVVGVNDKSLIWRFMKKKFGNDLLLIRSVPHPELKDIRAIADVYLDSYPISGFTALTESLTSGLPIIPIDTGFCYYDSIFKYRVSFRDATKAVEDLLNNKAMQKAGDCTIHFSENWSRALSMVYRSMPTNHSLHNIEPKQETWKLDVTKFHFFGGRMASFHVMKAKIPLTIKAKVLMQIFFLNAPLVIFSILLKIKIKLLRVFF